MQLSDNNQHLVTVSATQLKCWFVTKCQSVQLIKTIPLHQKKPVACISDNGEVVVVSNGHLFCDVYEGGHLVTTLDIV